MHSAWRGNESPGQQVTLEACSNTVQTGYADLNKPLEQVLLYFWYSFLKETLRAMSRA